jgi:GT2 family glycosyltransferase
MTDLPRVAVVILNWNGLDFLRKFLPSVCASTYTNLDIILGDNASSDHSVSFVRENYPHIKIIINDQNYGFAGGYNRVLSGLDQEYYVLLNSDVEVEPGWIEPVIQLMEKDISIAAAQPKILSQFNKELFEYAGAAGGFLDIFGYPFCRGRIFDSVELDSGQYDKSSEIFWASGAAFFIKRSKWLEMSGLDEDFFAHMEEIDLCWRLKNNNYKIMYCSESTVFHVGGGTLNADSPFKTYLNFRNNLVLLQKNLPIGRAIFIVFFRFWLDLLSLLKYLMDGKPKNALAISKAHVYFLRNLLSNIPKSRKISKNIFNKNGLYPGSIVWQYFVRQKKTFTSLKKTF